MLFNDSFRMSLTETKTVRLRNLFPCLFVLTMMVACSSSERSGIVYDNAGNPVAGVSVRLISVDDRGDETSVLDTTLTDANGKFNFDLSADANASVVVEANVTDGTLRGFWAGRGSSIPVHPLTHAQASLIFDITSSEGGRSVADFIAEELRDISDSIFAEDASSLDFSASEALRDFVRSVAGRKIALASGGGFSSQTSASFDASESVTTIDFEQNNTLCSLGYFIHTFSSSDSTFNLRADGTICGGSFGVSSMFSPGSFSLDLPAETFHLYGGSSFPVAVTSANAEGQRETVLGPYSLQVPIDDIDDPIMEDDLEVSRKIYVPQTGNFMRYLEIFSNTGSTSRTINFSVLSSLETGNESAVLTHDLDPLALSVNDRFFAAFDPNQGLPTAGFVYQDGLGTKGLSQLYAPGLTGGNINEVQYTWTNVTVPAGRKKMFVHYVLLSSSRTAADVFEALTNLVQNPDMSGFSRDELASLVNFTPNRGTVIGTAGAVIGNAEVTGTNARTSESIIVTAKADGSFFLPLDTQAGDSIAVTASDGLSTTITVP